MTGDGKSRPSATTVERRGAVDARHFPVHARVYELGWPCPDPPGLHALDEVSDGRVRDRAEKDDDDDDL